MAMGISYLLFWGNKQPKTSLLFWYLNSGAFMGDLVHIDIYIILHVHGFVNQIISGWWFEPLWKILVNWDDYSQYMGK